MFLNASSVANIKTSKTTFIDLINYIGYLVNIYQFIFLVLNNFAPTIYTMFFREENYCYTPNQSKKYVNPSELIPKVT